MGALPTNMARRRSFLTPMASVAAAFCAQASLAVLAVMDELAHTVIAFVIDMIDLHKNRLLKQHQPNMDMLCAVKSGIPPL